MTSEKNGELLPCPFCGWAELWANYSKPSFSCDGCGAMVSAPDIESARALWQSRTQKVSDDELQRLIDIAVENRTRVIKATFQNERQARIERHLQMDVQMKYIQDIKKRLETLKEDMQFIESIKARLENKDGK